MISSHEIYLDNSATTQVGEKVAVKVCEMLTDNYGNPSSLHTKGFQAQKILDETRIQIAEKLGAGDKEIFFTSGGTEANNLALIGTALKRKKMGNKIITSAIEHSSVLEACKYLESLGFEVVYLPVGEDGVVRTEDISNAIDNKTILVSLMYANNEIGTIQPVEKVHTLLKRKKSQAYFHIDAVQAFGKIPFKNTRLQADMISVSAHKIHAPKGIGAIYIKNGTNLIPRQFGGEQQKKIRPGTESTALIAGFGQAVQEINYDCLLKMQHLNDCLRKHLAQINDIHINSPENALPYILNFSVANIKSETMVHFLEEKAIYVSSGSACAKGKQSHVLQAMKLPKNLSDTAIRVSFSRYNTTEDIDRLAEALSQGIRTLAKMK